MKLLPAITLGLLFSTLLVHASSRIAIVRVTDIYKEMPSTGELQERIRKERDAILKDQRAEELRRALAEFQALQAQLKDQAGTDDEEARRKLARDYEIKRQETLTLQEEFENFRKERNHDINRRMVASMRESLNLIAEISSKIAKEQGFDHVFDGSGNTNTGVPFILHAKDAPDITDTVKAALQDALPKQTPPAEEEEP